MVNLDYIRLVSQSYNGLDVTESLSVLKQSVTIFRSHSALKSIIPVTKGLLFLSVNSKYSALRNKCHVRPNMLKINGQSIYYVTSCFHTKAILTVLGTLPLTSIQTKKSRLPLCLMPCYGFFKLTLKATLGEGACALKHTGGTP